MPIDGESDTVSPAKRIYQVGSPLMMGRAASDVKEAKMGQPYSSGVWIAESGREAEFIAAWREFATWSLSAIEGASWAVLLQDRSKANRFVSFGPWESLETMEAWRSHPGFAERMARIRPLIESLGPSTLEAVVEVGTGPQRG